MRFLSQIFCFMKTKCCASAYVLFQNTQKQLEDGFEMPTIYEWNDFF